VIGSGPRRVLAPVRNAAIGGRLRNVGGWLPGALTLGNLLAGFGSIVMAMQGRFWIAFWLIFAAAVLDGLDGRVARITGTVSEFGAELDSLCDAVSFAVAPSLLAFQLGVGTLGRVGWGACFVFVACGVIRLARFNATSGDTSDFIGLPIPMAAAAASMPALMTGGGVLPPLFVPAHGLLLVVTGLLMVSRLRYPSFKRLRFGPNPYRVLAIWSLVLAAFIVAAEWVAPVLVAGYLLSPSARRYWRRLEVATPDASDEEPSAPGGPLGSRGAR
jgi:CDP-diacylglycerol--serine O-phosphatidyltransferase